MLSAICNKWWVFLLNGIAAILFGIMAFVWPGVTLLTLILLFGFYCIADGIAAIFASFARSEATGGSWWQMLLLGAISLIAGVVAIAWPGISAAALLFVIAGWAIIHGVFEIAAAIALRKVIDHEWMLVVAGIVSILFGIVLVAQPAAGALVVIWWIGAFAILRGIFLAALAFKLRKIRPLLPGERSFAASH